MDEVPPAPAPPAPSPVVKLRLEGVRFGRPGAPDVLSGVDLDVFAGKAALRVGAMQRFNSAVKDWDFQIAEKPMEGEYRYLRFAWKKIGDGPMMLQFHTRRPNADWNIRYYMGPDAPPWAAKVLAPQAPAEWQVVTCDLFKDFGTVSVSGVAFVSSAGPTTLVRCTRSIVAAVSDARVASVSAMPALFTSTST